MVARAFVAKPEDLATANSTLWDSVESDGLDPGPTTSSAVHKSKNASNFARDVNTNSLNHARNSSFSGDFLHAIALGGTPVRDTFQFERVSDVFELWFVLKRVTDECCHVVSQEC